MKQKYTVIILLMSLSEKILSLWVVSYLATALDIILITF